MFRVGDVVRITTIKSKHFNELGKVIRVLQNNLGEYRFAVTFGKRGRPPFFIKSELEKAHYE